MLTELPGVVKTYDALRARPNHHPLDQTATLDRMLAKHRHLPQHFDGTG